MENKKCENCINKMCDGIRGKGYLYYYKELLDGTICKARSQYIGKEKEKEAPEQFEFSF